MQHGNRLVNLQLLRIFAAVAVVAFHARLHTVVFDKSFIPGSLGWGYSGVDVFFVISGFIMVYITAGRPIGPDEFIARRFFRVWPLYLVLTLVAAAIVLFVPAYYKGDDRPLYILQSLLFIPARRDFDGQFYPLLNVGWTLNLEVAFYALFAVSLFFKRQILALFVMVGALIGSGYVFKSDLLYFYGQFARGPFVEFLFGVVLAHIYRANVRIPTSVAIASLIGGIAMIIAQMPGARPVVVGLPAFMVVLGALYIPAPKSLRLAECFDFLGRSSYALYLSHFIVLSVFRRTLLNEHLGPNSIPAFVYIGSAVALSLAIAVAIYVLLERPFDLRVSQPFLKKIFRREASRTGRTATSVGLDRNIASAPHQ